MKEAGVKTHTVLLVERSAAVGFEQVAASLGLEKTVEVNAGELSVCLVKCKILFCFC